METRTIEQVKIYYLILNHVKDKSEVTRVVAASPFLHKLIGWYSDKCCEEYREDGYLKHFKKGSLLEFFNPASNLIPNETDCFGCGIRAEWESMEDYHHMMSGKLPVPFLQN